MLSVQGVTFSIVCIKHLPGRAVVVLVAVGIAVTVIVTTILNKKNELFHIEIVRFLLKK